MTTMRWNGFGFALAGIAGLLLFKPGIALSAAAADESAWCAEHRQSLASRRAVLAAEEPDLKAGMVAAFTRLESQVGAVADRAPALMERVVDLKGSAGDLSYWWKFSNLFHDAGQQLQSFGKGITAWDIDIVDSLGARITRHESLAYGVDLDEPLYRASCTDPPRGASAKAIAEAMKAEGIMEPEVLLYINLMTEFRTSSVWSLAAIQEKASSDPDWIDYGPLFVCFLKGQSPDCAIGTGAPATLNLTDDANPYVFYEARVVQASPDGKNPRLLVKTCTEPGGDGGCGINTTLYAYDRAADRFDTIFNNVTGHNRNQKTRFVESGPIQSDIIVNYPTDDAPYTYWVEVHRQQSDGRYAQILKYRGKTGYNDGNALAVADSEMPEILRRLGKWKQGDPLPVLPKMPVSCTSIYLEGTLEWCR